MANDLRFGLRMLFKQPGFALITVLTLALGIGATSAVFSLIQGVLLTPPAYENPERLVTIPSVRTDGQKVTRARGWPSLIWMDWQKEAKSFDGIAAYDWTFNFLVLEEGSESLQGMAVTRDYFSVAGLKPLQGRIFDDAETRPGGPRVIILGYDLWKRKFNGDPGIVGKPIRISRQEVQPTVIGIMPPGIRFLPAPTQSQEPNYDVNAMVDFWAPITPNPERAKRFGWNVMARLRKGVSLEAAKAELTVLTDRQAKAEREFEGVAPQVQSLTGEYNGDGERILLPLLGAAALVLLIACGNVAALLLVRGLQRQQEYAVRSALGVGRIALFRQVSTETLLLALTGGALGVGLAFGLVRVFKIIGHHAIPRLDDVSTGLPILAFGLVSAIFAAMLAGLLPAFRASRMDPINSLKDGGPKSSAGRGERRLLQAVTLAQTALTLTLLVGAGLLIRTMVNLSKVQSGYSMDRVLTMSVTSVQGDWADFHQRALERVAAVPGVQHVAFAWGVPLTGNNWPAPVDIEGQPAAATEAERVTIPLRSVTPDYFTLMNLPILQGRDFRATDKQKAPAVSVVNQAFADRYFPNQNPVGKHFWIGGRKANDPGNEVVGLVKNGRTDDLTRPAEPEIYLSFWQAGPFSKHMVVRTASEPRAVISAIQRELRGVNPTVAVEHMKTLEQLRGDSLASRTFAMQLLIGFAFVGSVLTLVGIYGVLSLSVASRRREIAIRTAVGAEKNDIMRLIFGEGFKLIGVGILAGLAGAFVVARVLRTFLYGVSGADPLTVVSVVLLFAGVAALACWVPGRRAAKVNPLDALRYE